MMTDEEMRQTISALLEEEPVLGLERLPSAVLDYHRLIPSIRAEVHSRMLSAEQSVRHNRDYRSAILRLVSVECAAGVSVARCKTWFYCLACLSLWKPLESQSPVDPADAAVWAALSGRIHSQIHTQWPVEPGSEGTTARVVYRLYTQIKVEMQSPPLLFDNKYWEDLCTSIEADQVDASSKAFRSIASWWIKEYRNTETSAYDPEHFATFEPAPNAALTISLLHRRMPIRLHKLAHRRFYYVALMLSELDE